MLYAYQNLSWLPYLKWWWQFGNSWLWLFRADHPSNTKRGGVCIYYRNSLPLKILGSQYLKECINFEIKIGGKLRRFVSLYRSPSQSQDDFEAFANNFELNLDAATANNTFLTVVLGDLNAKSNLWFKGDKTTYEGSKIDGITSTFGLQQIMSRHIFLVILLLALIWYLLHNLI